MSNMYTDEYSNFAVQELYASDDNSDQSSETCQREIEEMLYSQIHYGTVEHEAENKKEYITTEHNFEVVDITNDGDKKTGETVSKCDVLKDSLQDNIVNFEAENKTDAIRQKNVKNLGSFPPTSNKSDESVVGLETFLSLNTNEAKSSTIISRQQEKTKSRNSGKSFGPVVTVESDSDSIVLDSPLKSSIKKSTMVDHVCISEDSDESLYIIDDIDDSLLPSTSFAISKEEDIKLHVKDTKQNIVLDYNEMDGFENMSLEDVINSLGECDWSIKPADRYLSTSHVASRYYSPITVKCNNCSERGHLSKDCPKPKKIKNCSLCGREGHMFRRCPNSLCFNCDQPGHESRDCIYPRRRHTDQCNRCRMYGHKQFNCPEIWRQYHSTTTGQDPKPGNNKQNKNAWCYNCARKGHFGYECNRDHMDRFTLPTCPFIVRYDKHVQHYKPRHIHFDNSNDWQQKQKGKNTHINQQATKRKKEKDSPSQMKKHKKEEEPIQSGSYTDVLRQRYEVQSKKLDRTLKKKEKKEKRTEIMKQMLREEFGVEKISKKKLRELKKEMRKRNNEKKMAKKMERKRGKRGGQKKSNDRSVSIGFKRGFQMTIKNTPNRRK